MMILIDNDQMLFASIVFSDEIMYFTLHGEVNLHNCLYWADHNPHWIRETHTQRLQKVNVWPEIIGHRIVGPVFFNDNLNVPMYLTFLQEALVLGLAALFPNALDPDLPDDDERI
jgi:hypothetical protein